MGSWDRAFLCCCTSSISNVKKIWDEMSFFRIHKMVVLVADLCSRGIV